MENVEQQSTTMGIVRTRTGKVRAKRVGEWVRGGAQQNTIDNRGGKSKVS